MANKEIIAKKAEAVDKLLKEIQGSKSYILCEYAGLTVNKMEELRKQLRASDCLIKVATNNTIKRASALDGFNELVDTIGPSCIVISKSESVDGPRIVQGFAKDNKNLVMKDGVVDGKYYDEKGIAEIAKLPSRLTLLAMLAGGMYQPIQQLAVGLNMLVEKDSKEAAPTETAVEAASVAA